MDNVLEKKLDVVSYFFIYFCDKYIFCFSEVDVYYILNVTLNLYDLNVSSLYLVFIL